MISSIHPDNPQQRLVDRVVKVLKDGGVIVYPTDTVYAFGCDALNSRGAAQIARIKGIRPEKANFSLVCSGLSNIANYALVDNSVFRIMKKALPGPFTFILPASSHLPKAIGKRKSVGIRVPDNKICAALVEGLGNPIISSSLYDEDEILEYTSDPEMIDNRYGNLVALIVDGGPGLREPSTVIDCIGETPVLIRQGLGIIEGYF